MIMSFGINGLNLLATSTYLQDVVVGVIIIGFGLDRDPPPQRHVRVKKGQEGP